MQESGGRKASKKQANKSDDLGAKSPLLSMVKVGSGGLLPLSAPTMDRPLVAITVPPDEQPGTLLVVDVPVSPDQAITFALENPVRALFVASYFGHEVRRGLPAGAPTSNPLSSVSSPEEDTPPNPPARALRPVCFNGLPVDNYAGGVILRDTDIVVHQFRALLSAATVRLDHYRGDPLATSDRIRAREIIYDLTKWALRIQVVRSGQDANASLTVPMDVGAAAFELARIGRRLPLYERERLAQEAADREEPSRIDDLSDIPALDTTSSAWLKSKHAAALLSVDTETLANYRLAGSKSKGRMCGRDQYGRIWRRASKHAHVWYLRSTLKPSAEARKPS